MEELSLQNYGYDEGTEDADEYCVYHRHNERRVHWSFPMPFKNGGWTS